MDVVRKILLIMESSDQQKFDFDTTLVIPDIDRNTKRYYFLKMREANLINHIYDECEGNEYSFVNIELTWDGHQFIEQIREESFWNKLKRKLVKSGVGLSIFAIKTGAPLLIKELLT